MGQMQRNIWLVLFSMLLLAIPAYFYREQLFFFLAFSAKAQGSYASELMVPIAKYGPVLLALVLLLLVIFNRKTPIRRRLTVLVSPLVAWGINRICKSLFQEVRPCEALSFESAIPCPHSPLDWSFPSGHSAIAAGLAVACILLWKKIWPLAIALAFLFGYGRVAVGVHYVHDVLVGWVIGAAFTIICCQGFLFLWAKITSDRPNTKITAP